MNPDERFAEWLHRVDCYLTEHYGVVLDDLPDVPTRDWYDQGKTSGAAARCAIKLAQ